MNIEYTDLRAKEVVNILDGRRLGRVIDLLLETECGRIKGIIVPGERGFNLFKNGDDIYIPWKNIKRIGDDVILVEVPVDLRTCSTKKIPNPLKNSRVIVEENEEEKEESEKAE